MPTKLTQKFVDALPVGASLQIRALSPKGLVVRVGRTSKSYVVMRELWVGTRGSKRLAKTCVVTLGRCEDMRLDEAVERAQDVLAQIRRGVDPNAKTSPHSGAWTVQRAYDQYLADLLKSGGAESTAALTRERLSRYLGDWLGMPIAEITPQMWVDRHTKIMADVKGRAKNARATGARSANQALRDFRAVWNRIAKIDQSLTNNPAHAVREARERKAHHQVQPEDLRDWAGKVALLPSPLRQRMHMLGLFSGLRPGNLVAIEREWVRLEKQAICFPAEVMKGRRPFDLPLSAHMVGLLREALTLSEMTFAGAPWLFPTREHDSKRRKERVATPRVIATQVWKERTLPNATGHALRHTYSNLAGLARVDETSRMMLMAQKIPGIQGRYLDQPTLFSRLLEDQEKVTAHVLSLIK
jgi:integrase